MFTICLNLHKIGIMVLLGGIVIASIFIFTASYDNSEDQALSIIMIVTGFLSLSFNILFLHRMHAFQGLCNIEARFNRIGLSINNINGVNSLNSHYGYDRNNVFTVSMTQFYASNNC